MARNGSAPAPFHLRLQRRAVADLTIACPDCGTLQDLPRLARGAAAICPVCDHKLERTNGRSIAAALACSLATFMLLFPANLLPFLSVSLLGVTRMMLLGSGVVVLWDGQWIVVAVLVGAFAVVLPFVQFGLLSAVLACIAAGRKRPWLGRAFRWTHRLDLWAMPDVFLIGCFIGYSRVEAAVPVTIGPGGFCFMAAAFFTMISRAALDRRTVWRTIAPERSAPPSGQPEISCTVCDLIAPATMEGGRCPRCAARLHARKPAVAIHTTALLIAGLVLYFPANVFPMSVDTQLGQPVEHRIIDGIKDLFQAGLWPLGVLIFCTSIAIPLLKIVGLGWCLISIRRRSSRRLILRTKLYRFIDEIGRWSNVDVFTIAVIVPLFRFDGLASSHAAIGVTAFVLVVVLTMLASQGFDARLMWDAANVDGP